MTIKDISDFPESPGIYKIISPTGKIYIGQSLNLRKRCLFYLNPNRVKNQRGIYNSLIKYSVESHQIEILELCEEVDLMIRERFWQEYHDSVNDGLNCILSPTIKLRKRFSIETLRIMSEKSQGSNNHFYGKKHNEESLKKISNRSSGKNNPNYGGKLKTEEWLKKQSISNSKKHLIIEDTLTGDQLNFPNSKEAAIFLNCSPSTIRSYKSWGLKYKKRFWIKDKV